MVDHCILDKRVIVEAGCYIGFGDDFQFNREQPNILNSGLTVIGKGAKIPEGVKIGHNCAIDCNVTERDFHSLIVQSGETIKAKRRRLARKE
jgi:glucose-1-phosphate adenylyltransferase